MKRLLDILRYVILSPELVISLITCVIFEYERSWFTSLGERFYSNSEVTNGLLLGSLITLGWTFKESKSILFPKEENKIILGWKDYPMLKGRVYFGLILLLGCVVSSITLVFIRNDIPRGYFGLAVVITLLVLGTVVVTHAMASISVRHILESEQ